MHWHINKQYFLVLLRATQRQNLKAHDSTQTDPTATATKEKHIAASHIRSSVQQWSYRQQSAEKYEGILVFIALHEPNKKGQPV